MCCPLRESASARVSARCVSAQLIKLLELLFVVVSAVERMVDAGELRAMDGLEPMGRLDFEKKEHILRFFELAMVSVVGLREALDAVKPLRLQKLEGFCCFERTVL